MLRLGVHPLSNIKFLIWKLGSTRGIIMDSNAWILHIVACSLFGSYIFLDRLTSAGAVLIAKLATGSLAYDDIWFGGRTRNPWNIEEFSTGSSAGPAASTSAGLWDVYIYRKIFRYIWFARVLIVRNTWWGPPISYPNRSLKQGPPYSHLSWLMDGRSKSFSNMKPSNSWVVDEGFGGWDWVQTWYLGWSHMDLYTPPDPSPDWIHSGPRTFLIYTWGLFYALASTHIPKKWIAL